MTPEPGQDLIPAPPHFFQVASRPEEIGLHRRPLRAKRAKSLLAKLTEQRPKPKVLARFDQFLTKSGQKPDEVNRQPDQI